MILDLAITAGHCGLQAAEAAAAEPTPSRPANSQAIKNSGGGYTRTLTDGTQITFNSGGYETATIDLNSQHITFAYNGSNQISTITDNYSNITTFSYSGGYLQTIKDPGQPHRDLHP